MAAIIAPFMEVLDTSIANVALPYIAGNLSSSDDEAVWVLTSYLVANAIILPISGWISGRLGRKRFYLISVVLFTVGSLLCGIAPNLPYSFFFECFRGWAVEDFSQQRRRFWLTSSPKSVLLLPSRSTPSSLFLRLRSAPFSEAGLVTTGAGDGFSS